MAAAVPAAAPASTSGISAEDKAAAIANIASELKATEIIVLDLRGISGITDYFVLLTGNSQLHLRAISRRIEDDLRERGVRASSVDGARSTGWVAMDYGNVIVHAMTQDSRKLYDLERLWGDAPRVELLNP